MQFSCELPCVCTYLWIREKINASSPKNQQGQMIILFGFIFCCCICKCNSIHTSISTNLSSLFKRFQFQWKKNVSVYFFLDMHAKKWTGMLIRRKIKLIVQLLFFLFHFQKIYIFQVSHGLHKMKMLDLDCTHEKKKKYSARNPYHILSSFLTFKYSTVAQYATYFFKWWNT